jgi:hypothetical protein
MFTAIIQALTPNRSAAARIHPMNEPLTNDETRLLTTSRQEIASIANKDPCERIYAKHRSPGAYDEYKKWLA